MMHESHTALLLYGIQCKQVCTSVACISMLNITCGVVFASLQQSVPCAARGMAHRFALVVCLIAECGVACFVAAELSWSRSAADYIALYNSIAMP